MNDLAGKSFELIENNDGYAAGSTVLKFGASLDPYQAIYSGPNIKFGQAIVSEDEMLYHALDSEGCMASGYAKVKFEGRGDNSEMILHWQWLTGGKSNGISRWRNITS